MTRRVFEKLWTKKLALIFWPLINPKSRHRIVLPEGLLCITETDLWECWQRISPYRYRFSLDYQLISIADTDLGQGKTKGPQLKGKIVS